MDNDVTFNLLVIALLVLANGFFVAAEYALVRVRKTKIEKLITEGVSGASVVRHSMNQMDRYISATQVGVTLASLALGWRGEPFIASWFHRLFDAFLPNSQSNLWANGIAVAVALFGITFIHVVVGEIMPKSIALQFPETVAVYLVRPMQFCLFLFRPLIWMLNGTSRAILKVFGIKSVDAHSLALTEEELLLLLSESKKAGVVSEEEQKMLQRVFKFHDKTVREIMTPRPDMEALSLRADVDTIRAAFEKGYSRLPVYDENLNNIKGIVYVKDLLYTLQDPKLIKLVDLLREPVFVPETMPVSSLLKDFQKGQIHMAIVVDEFGDTAGLVTLEDVIEEIVGEIQDEYDYEPAEVQRATDGSLIFDGKTSMARFKEIFPEFEPPEGSFETVAGLVFQIAGRVPKEGDTVSYGDLSFKTTKREGRRLRKITVKGASRVSFRGTAESSLKLDELAGKRVAPQVAANTVHGESPAAAADIPPAGERHTADVRR
jgi:CBS domain containing-hemolysin-like protein